MRFSRSEEEVEEEIGTKRSKNEELRAEVYPDAESGFGARQK
jgi:hypothetical protein